MRVLRWSEQHLHPSATLLAVRRMNAGAAVLRAARLVFTIALGLFVLPSCSKYDELVEKDQTAQER